MKFMEISRGAVAEATVASRSIVVRRRPIEVSDKIQRGGGKLNCKGMVVVFFSFYKKGSVAATKRTRPPWKVAAKSAGATWAAAFFQRLCSNKSRSSSDSNRSNINNNGSSSRSKSSNNSSGSGNIIISIIIIILTLPPSLSLSLPFSLPLLPFSQ